MPFPTPHGDKLQALLSNSKLPADERQRIATAIERYHAWIAEMGAVEASEAAVEPLVGALNAYKLFLDIDLVFDSETDFLYRQKGQLKLDNTVVEEFLPWLVGKVLAQHLDGKELQIGPTNCFSGIRFESDLRDVKPGGGIAIRSKDHDFAVSRRLHLRASHRGDFSNSVLAQTAIAYIATECKTNLDKTMFQEAAATALDVKTAVPGAKYYLMCEWLDMTPISTASTAIDEVIILRKNRRLGSDVRRSFSSLAGRRESKESFLAFLTANPYAVSSFERFLRHIKALVVEDYLQETAVLERGWF